MDFTDEPSFVATLNVRPGVSVTPPSDDAVLNQFPIRFMTMEVEVGHGGAVVIFPHSFCFLIATVDPKLVRIFQF